MFYSSRKKKSPFTVAIITAIVFLAAFLAGSWIYYGEPRVKEAFLGAIIIWLVYFALQAMSNKRLEKN